MPIYCGGCGTYPNKDSRGLCEHCLNESFDGIGMDMRKLREKYDALKIKYKLLLAEKN